MKSRTEKSTIYLSVEIFNAGHDLAFIRNLSWPKYIEYLIQQDINANEDTLKKLQELKTSKEREDY